MESSYVIRHERCPECAKLGKDTSGNNLAVYSDNHRYCFGCGWHSGGSRLSGLHLPNGARFPNLEQITLPHDSSYDYPKAALDWIEQYEISRNDLLAHRVVYSDYYYRLIFPVYSGEGILAYQGRYFGPDTTKPKWWGEGNLARVYNIMGRSSTKSIVLVEDILSSIKISNLTTVMPLYGSYISKERILHLKLLGYEKLVVFLDPDKRRETIKFCRLGNLLGISTCPIFAAQDPKEMKSEELKKLLDFSSQ